MASNGNERLTDKIAPDARILITSESESFLCPGVLKDAAGEFMTLHETASGKFTGVTYTFDLDHAEYIEADPFKMLLTPVYKIDSNFVTKGKS